MEEEEFDFPEAGPELQKDVEEIEQAPVKKNRSEKELEEELREMKKKIQ